MTAEEYKKMDPNELYKKRKELHAQWVKEEAAFTKDNPELKGYDKYGYDQATGTTYNYDEWMTKKYINPLKEMDAVLTEMSEKAKAAKKAAGAPGRRQSSPKGVGGMSQMPRSVLSQNNPSMSLLGTM